MDKKIKQILDDLYMIDKDLKNHEDELIKIAEKLIESKPDVRVDEKFVEELKLKLLHEAEKIENATQNNIGLGGFVWMKNAAYALGGAAVCILLVFSFTSKDNKLQFSMNDKQADLIFNSGVKKLANNAFGSFSKSDIPNQEGGGLGRGDGGTAATALNAAGGGLLDTTAPVMMESTDEVAVSRKMVAMPFIENRVNYEYVYNGEELPDLSEEMLVYKRNKESEAASDLASLVSGVDFDLLGLDNFRDTWVSSFNIMEDKEFGHSVYFDLQENTVSIGTNWRKWPNPTSDCRDNKCFEKYRLKVDDVPEDAKIIKIADDFLENYEIDTVGYGEGMVQDDWRVGYEALKNKRDAYIPETISVVYPLKIDDKVVYENWGNITGLTVQVNIRYNKVNGVRNIYAHSFDSSSYEAEKDSERILKIAQNGGVYGNYRYQDPTETVTIELGTPNLELVRVWKMGEDKYENEEFYVPAYIFPIVNQDEKLNLNKNSIIIPVIKEMLDEEDDIPVIEPYPMPLLRGAVDSEIEDDVKIEVLPEMDAEIQE